jgi:transcriptional regulator with XRE-family HTH domain
MSLTRNVSTQLVERRVSLGLSRRDAAKMWGYCKATVERLERHDSRFLSLEKLSEYADALGMEIKVDVVSRPDFQAPEKPRRLTKWQVTVYRFIQRTIAQTGESPNYAQLMKRFRWKAEYQVCRMLNKLKDHGLIATEGRGVKCGIRILRTLRSDELLAVEAQ